jgi:hypothetical protein
LLAVVKREIGFVPPSIEALIGTKTNNGITNEVDILEDRRAVDACETKWSVPWFECDESLTWQGLNSNSGHFASFTFIFVSCVKSRLLVS